MRRGSRALTATLLALAVTMTGCGGDDDKSDSDSKPLTKAEFIKQADAICAAGDKAIDKAGDELGDDPTEDEILAFASDTLVPNIQGQHDDLADLEAPDEIADDVDSLLDSLQDGIDAVKDDTSLLLGTENPFADASAKARDLGLTDCGEE